MKINVINSTIVSAALVVLVSCGTTTNAPSTPPSATVTIKEFTAAYYGSAQSGKGVLFFNGGRHRFSIAGVGAGGAGGQKVNATGKVYNLNRLADFPGTYQGVSSGLTLIEGKMHAKLKNGNGVVMYIAGDTEGVASSIGVQAYQITLN